MARQRLDWCECRVGLDPERLVFLDEFGLNTAMTRFRGWAEAGHRLVEAIPAGHWQSHTVVQAVALDGTRAAMVLDGAMNSLCFAGFCERFLAPTLNPGDLVVLDNLSSHKSTAAAVAIERVGARLVHLPPYSPDLNPIENLFSKLKQFIRALRPRHWSQIVDATRRALDTITLRDIDHAFTHCGYGYGNS